MAAQTWQKSVAQSVSRADGFHQLRQLLRLHLMNMNKRDLEESAVWGARAVLSEIHSTQHLETALKDTLAGLNKLSAHGAALRLQLAAHALETMGYAPLAGCLPWMMDQAGRLCGCHSLEAFRSAVAQMTGAAAQATVQHLTGGSSGPTAAQEAAACDDPAWLQGLLAEPLLHALLGGPHRDRLSQAAAALTAVLQQVVDHHHLPAVSTMADHVLSALLRQGSLGPEGFSPMELCIGILGPRGLMTPSHVRGVLNASARAARGPGWRGRLGAATALEVLAAALCPSAAAPGRPLALQSDPGAGRALGHHRAKVLKLLSDLKYDKIAAVRKAAVQAMGPWSRVAYEPSKQQQQQVETKAAAAAVLVAAGGKENRTGPESEAPQGEELEGEGATEVPKTQRQGEAAADAGAAATRGRGTAAAPGGAFERARRIADGQRAAAQVAAASASKNRDATFVSASSAVSLTTRTRTTGPKALREGAHNPTTVRPPPHHRLEQPRAGAGGGGGGAGPRRGMAAASEQGMRRKRSFAAPRPSPPHKHQRPFPSVLTAEKRLGAPLPSFGGPEGVRRRRRWADGAASIEIFEGPRVSSPRKEEEQQEEQELSAAAAGASSPGATSPPIPLPSSPDGYQPPLSSPPRRSRPPLGAAGSIGASPDHGGQLGTHQEKVEEPALRVPPTGGTPVRSGISSGGGGAQAWAPGHLQQQRQHPEEEGATLPGGLRSLSAWVDGLEAAAATGGNTSSSRHSAAAGATTIGLGIQVTLNPAGAAAPVASEESQQQQQGPHVMRHEWSSPPPALASTGTNHHHQQQHLQQQWEEGDPGGHGRRLRFTPETSPSPQGKAPLPRGDTTSRTPVSSDPSPPPLSPRPPEAFTVFHNAAAEDDGGDGEVRFSSPEEPPQMPGAEAPEPLAPRLETLGGRDEGLEHGGYRPGSPRQLFLVHDNPMAELGSPVLDDEQEQHAEEPLDESGGSGGGFYFCPAYAESGPGDKDEEKRGEEGGQVIGWRPMELAAAPLAGAAAAAANAGSAGAGRGAEAIGRVIGRQGGAVAPASPYRSAASASVAGFPGRYSRAASSDSVDLAGTMSPVAAAAQASFARAVRAAEAAFQDLESHLQGSDDHDPTGPSAPDAAVDNKPAGSSVASESVAACSYVSQTEPASLIFNAPATAMYAAAPVSFSEASAAADAAYSRWQERLGREGGRPSSTGRVSSDGEYYNVTAATSFAPQSTPVALTMLSRAAAEAAAAVATVSGRPEPRYCQLEGAADDYYEEEPDVLSPQGPLSPCDLLAASPVRHSTLWQGLVDDTRETRERPGRPPLSPSFQTGSIRRPVSSSASASLRHFNGDDGDSRADDSAVALTPPGLSPRDNMMAYMADAIVSLSRLQVPDDGGDPGGADNAFVADDSVGPVADDEAALQGLCDDLLLSSGIRPPLRGGELQGALRRLLRTQTERIKGQYYAARAQQLDNLKHRCLELQQEREQEELIRRATHMAVQEETQAFLAGALPLLAAKLAGGP